MSEELLEESCELLRKANARINELEDMVIELLPANIDKLKQMGYCDNHTMESMKYTTHLSRLVGKAQEVRR